MMEAYYPYRTLSYPGLEYSSFFCASFRSSYGAGMELEEVAVMQQNRHNGGKTSRPRLSLQTLSMDVASDGVYAVSSGRICIAALNTRNIDYVVDAVDTVAAKIEIIKRAKDAGTRVIRRRRRPAS